MGDFDFLNKLIALYSRHLRGLSLSKTKGISNSSNIFAVWKELTRSLDENAADMPALSPSEKQFFSDNSIIQEQGFRKHSAISQIDTE
jgi:hypothetical protein